MASESGYLGMIEIRTIVFVSFSGALSIILFALSYVFHRKDSKQFWHHAVRLPSQMRQPYWYLISISTGCRPWAGHESDVFLRLIGSKGDSTTFIINGDVHSRLWEADSHFHLYSSGWPLGDISRVIVACPPSTHRKRWYLGSIQIKLVTRNLERMKTWYFPYHEWIEVFLDPVKVTLCGAASGHDLNRRLMIGWLGRGISDLHIWTSVFSPLKYTAFGRSERILYISVEVLGSVMFSLFLNVLNPQMGAMILGFYGASCAMLPASLLEAALRRIQRKYKVLMEDIKWYKAAEDGLSTFGRPKTYRQYVIKSTHKKMNYELIFKPPKKENTLKKAVLKEILKDESKIWNWLDPSIPLPEPQIGKESETIQAESSCVTIYDDLASEEDDEDYTDDERTWVERFIVKIKNFFLCKNSQQDIAELLKTPSLETEESLISLAPPKIVPSMIAPVQTQQQTTAVIPYNVEDEIRATSASPAFARNDLIDLMPTQSTEESSTDDEPLAETKHPLLQMGDGFVVKPISIWKVDSNFSIGSFDTNSNGLGNFKAMESMPAGEFEGLKNPKLNLRKSHFTPSEIKVRRAFASERRGAVGNIIDSQFKNDDMPTDIIVPPEIEQLSMQENILVSWVYYDRCVHGNKWLKEDTPLTAVLHRNGLGALRHDVRTGLDVNTHGQRELKNQQQKRFTEEVRKKYPEPVPRERVFDMLIFPEYADKLTTALNEMISEPEAWSVIAEFLVEWAECNDGPVVFSEVIIKASTIEGGETLVRDVISCVTSSPVWSVLMNELTRRLRYQGDNVDRLKEKYGLDSGYLFDAQRKVAAKTGATLTRNLNLTSNFNIADTQSTCRVFNELQLLLEWRQRLHEQEIPLKNCPMKELKEEELKVLRKFYRSMLKTPEGCYLFAELLRQVILADDKGKYMVCRLMRYAIGQTDGVPAMNHLIQGVVCSGVEGRSLLIRIFSIVSERQPNGPRVIIKLADSLEMSEMGCMLLKDLQIDASRAHRLAYQVRQEIHEKLDPILKASKKYFCQLVISLNDIAKVVLRLADNAREVLEDNRRIEQDFSTLQKYTKSPVKEQNPKNDNEWYSERICCRRNEASISHSLLPAKNFQPSSNDSSIDLSDGVIFPPFVTRRPAPNSPVTSRQYKKRGNADNFQVSQDAMETATSVKECQKYQPCDTKRIRNMNEFFLQSKDFETFNIDFKYQKKYHELEKNHHHSNHEISRCWIPPLSSNRRHAVAFSNRIPGISKEPCVDWSDELREDPVTWDTLKLCTCHNQFLGSQENQDRMQLNSHLKKHNCLICGIASHLEDTEDQSNVFNIVTEQCQNIPVKSFSQLEGLPKITEDTIKNIQRHYNQIRTSNGTNNGADILNDTKNNVPFPSGYGANMTSLNGTDGEASQTYPHCGSPTANICECIDGRKQKKPYHVKTDRDLPHISVETKNEKQGTKHSCRCQSKKNATNYPDIALKRRGISENHQFSIVNPDSTHINGKPCSVSTKEYEFPIVAQSSSEQLRHLTRKFDPRYWASDDSDVSVFSNPPPNSQHICDKCNGVIHYHSKADRLVSKAYSKSLQDCNDHGTLADNERFYYLSRVGEIPRNTESIGGDSFPSEHENLSKKPSGENWENAAGCCNSPGCYGLLPRKTQYRHGNRSPENEDKQSATLNQYQSVNSCGKLRQPDSKTPLIAKFQNPEVMKSMFEDVCTFCKYPRFKCCDEFGKMSHRPDKEYCKCKSNSKKSESVGMTSVTPPHNICSNCHIRIGTQQSRPHARYLLPLKIVRCYENALAKFEQNPTNLTDSGLSLHTAIDIPDDAEEASVNDNEKLVLLDLMGLSGTKTIKQVRRRCKPKTGDVQKSVSEACSECSSLSSGICCHVDASRLQPVLHLQGFTCHAPEEDKPKLKPLSFDWWRRHEDAMKSMQACADDCVSLTVILAKEKVPLKTEHEATCKVCTTADLYEDGNCGDFSPLRPRFSECLPTVWRSTICSKVQEQGSAHKEAQRPRFYKELIDAVVKSTKTLLLTPDLRPSKLMKNNVLHRHVFGSVDPLNFDSEMDLNEGFDETHLTIISAERLSHFRSLMKCLHDIECQGALLQNLHLVTDKDVTMAALLERQKTSEEEELADETEKLTKDAQQTPTFIDLILDFMKNNSCGVVLDCMEMLQAPWELPVDQQLLASRLLKKIDSAISGISESSRNPVNDAVTWAESFQCIIDAYLSEVAFKALAQRSILTAIEKTNSAQWYMAELADIARLTIARIVRFSEMTQAATSNLKETIKDGLCDASSRKMRKDKEENEKTSVIFFPKRKEEYSSSDDECSDVKRHITALLKTGRDDSRATLDDVLISFERLRRNIYDDLQEAANLIKRISDLGDNEAVQLLKTANAKPVFDKSEETGCQSNGSCTSPGNADSITLRGGAKDGDVKKTISYEEIHTDAEGYNSVKRDNSKGRRNLQPTAGQSQDISSSQCHSNDYEKLASCSSLMGDEQDSTTHYSMCPEPSCAGADKINETDKDGRARANVNILRDKILQQKVVKKIQVSSNRVHNKQRALPEHFHDVFHIKSTSNFEQEGHTRTALQADKGRGMLQFIFGNEMTETEMVEAFHTNIKTLLDWQNSTIGYYLGTICRLFLLLTAVFCGVGACLVPIYYPPNDYTVFWSVPIAFLCLILILEPLKCCVVSWVLFMRRVRPAFHNSPIFLKSHPSLLEKSSLYHAFLSDGFQLMQNAVRRQTKLSAAAREFYEKFHRNRASKKLFDRRRRILPILNEEDIPIDLFSIPSLSNVANDVDSEPPSPSSKVTLTLASQSSEDSNLSSSCDVSHQDGGIGNQQEDVVVELVEVPVLLHPPENHSSGVSIQDSLVDSDESEAVSTSCDLDAESSTREEVPKHTPFIYCRYSNFPK